MRKLFFTILMGGAALTGQTQTVAGAGGLTGVGVKGAFSGADAGAIVVSQFIFDTAAFPESHAATIAETSKGLAAAWFGGTKERNPDVCIYISLKDKGAATWSAPVNVANGIQNDTLRYACWNPVLYQVPGGDLLLFYKIGPSPAKWKGWLIRSKDGGVSWSRPWALPKGFLGPIKDKPVRLANGTLLCPSSVEGNGWKVHFELTNDKATSWRMAGSVAAPGDQADANSEDKEPAAYQAIQPTIVLHADGSIEALCRSKNRAILSTSSTDNGKTWSPLSTTLLPNNNSGIDAVTLADGRELLVYNHVLPSPGQSRGDRSPLNVAVSKDGKSWYGAVVLENDTLGEYSYPAVIQSADRMVHIVYTWRRKKIKYVEIDPSKLETKEIVDGRWPSN
jgi:alpha-L-rhamnosidase